jgi:hypothetical protein
MLHRLRVPFAITAWSQLVAILRQLLPTYIKRVNALLPIWPFLKDIRNVVFIRRWKMSRSLLNIVKRSLLRLMLSGVGLASKDAVG